MYKEWPHNWEPKKKTAAAVATIIIKVEALLFLFDQFLVNKTTQEVGELAELIIFGKSTMRNIKIYIWKIKWNKEERRYRT